MNSDHRVAIALGSNLGDRAVHLRRAVDRLSLALTNVRLAPLIETEPVEVVGVQSPFLNTVVVAETALDPWDTLSLLQGIETAGDRQRPFRGAARTIDLDLVLYDDVIVETPTLQLPHPRFRARRFVLEPLAALAPTWRDPVTGLTVAELLARLPPG